MSQSQHYAGVGSRRTPQSVLTLMHQIARRLDALGWTLRSGGAVGADSAFESGSRRSDIYTVDDADEWNMVIAATHHPAWERCSEYARKLHARNVLQILGGTEDAPRSKFVVCWTPNGDASGGTGQAIRIARAYGVPVFDLGLDVNLQRLAQFVNAEQG